MHRRFTQHGASLLEPPRRCASVGSRPRDPDFVGRGFTALGLVLVVLAACGGQPDDGKTPTGARASCHADSDCVVTNQTGCCQACPQAPAAIPTLTYEQQKNRCAAASCAPTSDRVECPRVDAILDYVAKCDRGTCAAVKAGRNK